MSSSDEHVLQLRDSWNSFYASYDIERLDNPSKASYTPSVMLPIYPSPSAEERTRYDQFKYWEQAFQVWYDKDKAVFNELAKGGEGFLFVNFCTVGSSMEIDDFKYVKFSGSVANFSWRHGNVGKFATVSKGIVVNGSIELRITLKKFGDGFESTAKFTRDVSAYKPTLVIFRKLSAAESADSDYEGMLVIPINMPK